MIQLGLFILQLIAIGALLMFCLVFIVLTIIKWDNKKQVIFYGSLLTACIIATAFVWHINLFAAESENREDTIAAFESNFGFIPPDSVKEIKLKNYGIADSDVHWMAFTYDAAVFNKIILHDRPLEIADKRTPKYDEIVGKLKKNCGNCPDWLGFPDAENTKIFFKTNFLDRTSSEYYLWVNPTEKMVYLEVSCFD
jgi:hypothetical protein